MKTLIYIGGFELPDKNAAAHRVINNAKILEKLGYNVIFIDINREEKRSIIQTKSECFGFTRYSMQYTNKRLININDFKKICNIYIDELHAVVAYNYPGIALYKMRKYCKKNKIKLYADCTEWYGFQGETIIKKIIKGIDSYIRMNLVQPKLDGVIAISKYLNDFYKDKVPTIYVPPLTDISEKKWSMTKTSSNENVINVVYAGSPGRNKDNLNKIINSLETIPFIVFKIIGISKEEYLKNFPEDQIILKKIESKVFFLGRVSHEEVISLLKQSDFSMFYRDLTRVTIAGFPTKFSESITCGVPVITNKNSDLENFLHDGINGFWLEEDIVGSLTKIMNTGVPELKKMKEKVKNDIFDYNNYISTFKEIF